MAKNNNDSTQDEHRYTDSTYTYTIPYPSEKIIGFKPLYPTFSWYDSRARAKSIVEASMLTSINGMRIHYTPPLDRDGNMRDSHRIALANVHGRLSYANVFDGEKELYAWDTNFQPYDAQSAQFDIIRERAIEWQMVFLADFQDKHPNAYFGDPETEVKLPSDLELRSAMRVVMEKHVFDRNMAFITQSEWDGIPRIDEMFRKSGFTTRNGLEGTRYADDADKEEEYLRACSRTFVLSAVQRTFEPGTIIDKMCIFVSPQEGVGKSSFGKRLAGGTIEKPSSLYATTGTLTENNKGRQYNFFSKFDGALVAEVVEMNSLIHAPEDVVKEIIDDANPIYDDKFKQTAVHPVTAVLYGTTNREDFLKTGDNRRFLVLYANEVHDTDRDMMPMRSRPMEYINQIWAEGVYRYLQGERWNESWYTNLETLTQNKPLWDYQKALTNGVKSTNELSVFLAREIRENILDQAHDGLSVSINSFGKVATFSTQMVGYCKEKYGRQYDHNGKEVVASAVRELFRYPEMYGFKVQERVTKNQRDYVRDRGFSVKNALYVPDHSDKITAYGDDE